MFTYVFDDFINIGQGYKTDQGKGFCVPKKNANYNENIWGYNR